MSEQSTKESSGLTVNTTGSEPPGLRSAVIDMMRKAHVPGLSLAVVNADRQVLAGGFGTADLAHATPATPSSVYLWFSMSKIVTATAALRLADEGRLDLDSPIGEYVDYLHAPGKHQPTVRQLLNHTSGLANPMPIRWVHTADSAAPDPEALLQRLTSRRRVFRHPPGEAARYTNLGYLALGQVITVAADQPFEDHVHEAVLEPVGMSRTGFSYQPDVAAATGYVRAPTITHPALRLILPSGVSGARFGRFMALKPFYVDGPAYGGLVGDVLDAGRFLQLHLNDGHVGGQKVLNPESAAAMRRLDQAGKPFEHGLGWFRRPTSDRGDWVEHFGAGAGFWNVMRLYPDRGIGVVVMTNSTTTYDFEPLFDLLVNAEWG